MINVKNFHKRYRKNHAVKGVSLDVKPGEIYGLIGGPDGAGKSSLLKAIAGVMSYDDGEVWVNDVLVDSEAHAEKIKSQLGFMPQGLGLNLYPELSVGENIDFFAELRGVSYAELEQRKAQLLKMTQLTRFVDRPMKFLSGGMKQKLGLVCTLIHRPKLVILDEPTTGVNPLSRRDFWRILNQLVMDEGVTALVSTAYMDEASHFQHLSVMHRGQVMAQGSASHILAAYPGWVVVFSLAHHHERITEGLQSLLDAFERIDVLGQTLRCVSFVREQATLIAQLNQVFDDQMPWHLEPTTLEDVFMHLLKSKTHGAPKMPALVGKFTETNPPVLIRAMQLTKQFANFTAADGVAFDIKAGQILGLLGANGAGKSTVIKMLTGILPPTRGSGEIAGLSIDKNAQQIKQQLGYMSQSFSLYLDLTVWENIQLFGRIYGLYGRSLKARSEWVLQMSELSDIQNELVQDLPLGQRQRLALGCALIHEPKVLFLDEPTSGVDPFGRAKFWQILVRLAQDMGVAILVTTHYLAEAEHCHQLVLMQAGRVVAYDSPENLKQALQYQRQRQGTVVGDYLPSLEDVFVAHLETESAIR